MLSQGLTPPLRHCARAVPLPIAASLRHLATHASTGALSSSTRPATIRPRLPKDLVQRRELHWSSSAEGRGLKVSHIFGGLVGLGALVTIYGLLEYYYSLQTWPEPVRSHLRSALRCRNRGEIERAEGFFQQAIDSALLLPASALSPDPLQKLTGIYISLAALYESQSRPISAYSTLAAALAHLGSDPLRLGAIAGEWACREGEMRTLDEKDHVRAIALVQKLGHLALQLGSMRVPPTFPLPEDRTERGTASIGPTPAPTSWMGAAETYLSAALTAMLRLGLKGAAGKGVGDEAKPVVLGRDLDLPSGSDTEDDQEEAGRVDRRGVGMTMEALSEVYAHKGQFDMAGQLLLQAISLLLPPKNEATPPIRDRCQAALLMTTLSSHTSRPGTPDSTRIARSWSLRALQVADAAVQAAEGKADGAAGLHVCMRAHSVGAFNLGMLAERDKDMTAAQEHFEDSAQSARKVGFKEGQREAMEGLRRTRHARALMQAASSQ